MIFTNIVIVPLEILQFYSSQGYNVSSLETEGYNKKSLQIQGYNRKFPNKIYKKESKNRKNRKRLVVFVYIKNFAKEKENK